jgi:hypothetical protein
LSDHNNLIKTKINCAETKKNKTKKSIQIIGAITSLNKYYKKKQTLNFSQKRFTSSKKGPDNKDENKIKEKNNKGLEKEDKKIQEISSQDESKNQKNQENTPFNNKQNEGADELEKKRNKRRSRYNNIKRELSAFLKSLILTAVGGSLLFINFEVLLGPEGIWLIKDFYYSVRNITRKVLSIGLVLFCLYMLYKMIKNWYTTLRDKIKKRRK